MTYRALFQSIAFVVVALVVLAAGCGGRSGLEGFPDNGGNSDDGGQGDVTMPNVCSAGSCPGGCCDPNGVCQPGTGDGACGSTGQLCQDCKGAGFQSCDPVVHACRMSVPQCDATNCNGCCAGDTCFAGGDPKSCGTGGQACRACAANESCVTLGGGVFGGTCRAQQLACSAATCPSGCCDAFGTCQVSGVGNPTQCGVAGAVCQNCSQRGEQCMKGQCFLVPDAGLGPCSARCLKGCCDQAGLTCPSGNSDVACGNVGSVCQNCSAMGEVCVNGRCFPRPPEAGGCGPQTCKGCCDAFGNCQAGSVPTQCGAFGKSCEDCVPLGERCINQQCGFPQPSCDSQTCPFGCCDSSGTCQLGSLTNLCGNFGEVCQDCAKLGTDQQCVEQFCQVGTDAGVCSATTCPGGCCDGAGQCQQGLTGLQCGTSGVDCVNCLQVGDLCSAKQQCVPPPKSDAGPPCNQQTCPDGCCDSAGTCQPGQLPNICGSNGHLCVDCMKLGGGQCVGQACAAADGGTPCSSNCSGCCDSSGTCQGGFLNTQCGETGDTCQDCTALKPASTCDVNVSPRVCASQQTQCPGLYPSCPSPLLQAGPKPQQACSVTDLQNASIACSGGPNTLACNKFFASVDAMCASCLQVFDVDFAAQSGIRTCVAPFVDATCNHNSACITDCTAESCFGCGDPATTTQCDTQVQSGTCSTYTQADQCVATALAGPAAVCNPASYSSFGAWLSGVGKWYCNAGAH